MGTRKRPSTHKREREYQKRQRELRKAEKAALKRERRAKHDDAPAATDAVQGGGAVPDLPDE
jgi:hypothetical protein